MGMWRVSGALVQMSTCKRSSKACGKAAWMGAAAARSEPPQRLLIHVERGQLNRLRWHCPEYVCMPQDRLIAGGLSITLA